MITICCFCSFTIPDFIGLGTLIVTAYIAYYGRKQLLQFIADKKADFTYQVYIDFFNFINKSENSITKAWIFGSNEKPIDRFIGDEENPEWVKISDVLEKFEAVAVLWKKHSIDEDIFYGIISYYLDSANKKTKNPNLHDYIKIERQADKDAGIPNPEHTFGGTLYLISELDKLRKRREAFKANSTQDF
jgi:hypothetical protein